MFFGRTDAKAETPVLWPPHVKSWLTGKDWCWEGLGAGRKGDDPGWDGWMASRTRWTWVWVNPGSWWWTGRPGMLQFMGSQRVGHDWVTELNWTEWLIILSSFSCAFHMLFAEIPIQIIWPFKSGLFVVLLLSCKSSYIQNMWFLNIFSHSVGFL